MITLEGIVKELADSGTRVYVERLGGNVYGVTDYSGLMVTIDDGATSSDGPASVLFAEDGAEVWRGEIHSAAEIVPLWAAVSVGDTAEADRLEFGADRWQALFGDD